MYVAKRCGRVHDEYEKNWESTWEGINMDCKVVLNAENWTKRDLFFIPWEQQTLESSRIVMAVS